MTLAPLLPSIGKVLLATLVMGVVVGGGWQLVRGLEETVSVWRVTARVADLGALLGLIPLGVLAYGATLWALRIEGGWRTLGQRRMARTRSTICAQAPSASPLRLLTMPVSVSRS